MEKLKPCYLEEFKIIDGGEEYPIFFYQQLNERS